MGRALGQERGTVAGRARVAAVGWALGQEHGTTTGAGGVPSGKRGESKTDPHGGNDTMLQCWN